MFVDQYRQKEYNSLLKIMSFSRSLSFMPSLFIVLNWLAIIVVQFTDVYLKKIGFKTGMCNLLMDNFISYMIYPTEINTC
jgi:hypothetical protein